MVEDDKTKHVCSDIVECGELKKDIRSHHHNLPDKLPRVPTISAPLRHKSADKLSLFLTFSLI